MPIPGYFETLTRFGLEELKQGDIQAHNGLWAMTPDGDFQFGNTRINALFRLVERWRVNQPTLEQLYGALPSNAHRLKEVSKARAQGIGPSLLREPVQYHEETEALGDYESAASVYAGAILVVLNNVMQRCRQDLHASESRWVSANPKIEGHSVGVVFAAAAANFRHHDEWARATKIDHRQRASMESLCAMLDKDLLSQGRPTLRTNVCREVLLTISEGSTDRLYQLMFDYAKALASP
jgi:hypothetical protein